MTPRIERVLTTDPASGMDNNTWLVGDEIDVIVIDPAHDARPVYDAVAGRRVAAILLTHGHWDHVRAAVTLGAQVGVAPLLNAADGFLWRESHPDSPFSELHDGDAFEVAGAWLIARVTPGHTPGSMCILAESLGAVFTGDTLFPGGPGATRWAYSSFPTAIDSISRVLFTLDDATVVHPGHGDSTTIGAERPHLREWIARGW
ncbi:MAG TPA: MBL fold metallo-hydrolase [Arachnia sp.]|nr:MBL fold metallo-hydrolase [Arachnia sp.]HMT85981.1 MBL fold metallo-hydrolase [Arachnia sp.]